MISNLNTYENSVSPMGLYCLTPVKTQLNKKKQKNKKQNKQNQKQKHKIILQNLNFSAPHQPFDLAWFASETALLVR